MQFEHRLRALNPPIPLIMCCTRQNSSLVSYPEGNFERNQLLDSSIGLSPLYQTATSDLHVSTASVLHQVFTRLRPDLAKITIFRVTLHVLNSPAFQLTMASGPPCNAAEQHIRGLTSCEAITFIASLTVGQWHMCQKACIHSSLQIGRAHV